MEFLKPKKREMKSERYEPEASTPHRAEPGSSPEQFSTPAAPSELLSPASESSFCSVDLSARLLSPQLSLLSAQPSLPLAESAFEFNTSTTSTTEVSRLETLPQNKSLISEPQSPQAAASVETQESTVEIPTTESPAIQETPPSVEKSSTTQSITDSESKPNDEKLLPEVFSEFIDGAATPDFDSGGECILAVDIPAEQEKETPEELKGLKETAADKLVRVGHAFLQSTFKPSATHRKQMKKPLFKFKAIGNVLKAFKPHKMKVEIGEPSAVNSPTEEAVTEPDLRPSTSKEPDQELEPVKAPQTEAEKQPESPESIGARTGAIPKRLKQIVSSKKVIRVTEEQNIPKLTGATQKSCEEISEMYVSEQPQMSMNDEKEISPTSEDLSPSEAFLRWERRVPTTLYLPGYESPESNKFNSPQEKVASINPEAKTRPLSEEIAPTQEIVLVPERRKSDLPGFTLNDILRETGRTPPTPRRVLHVRRVVDSSTVLEKEVTESRVGAYKGSKYFEKLGRTHSELFSHVLTEKYDLENDAKRLHITSSRVEDLLQGLRKTIRWGLSHATASIIVDLQDCTEEIYRDLLQLTRNCNIILDKYSEYLNENPEAPDNLRELMLYIEQLSKHARQTLEEYDLARSHFKKCLKKFVKKQKMILYQREAEKEEKDQEDGAAGGRLVPIRQVDQEVSGSRAQVEISNWRRINAFLRNQVVNETIYLFDKIKDLGTRPDRRM